MAPHLGPSPQPRGEGKKKLELNPSPTFGEERVPEGRVRWASLYSAILANTRAMRHLDPFLPNILTTNCVHLLY
jgi:hypothetical protein